MSRLNSILAPLLACLIALTAQSAAVARTMPDAAGNMVICSGNGPVMVYVDASGNPVSAPHLCPDYALSLIVALDSPSLGLGALSDWTMQGYYYAVRGMSFERRSLPNARGPPRLT